MHLLKYTEGWTRRHFLEHTAKGIMAAGLIAPLWQVIGNSGTCEAAYPPELLSIEAYTKGKLKIGGVLNADNVDIVKDILNPGLYHQIKNEGRVCDLAPSETRLDHLMPKAYLEATLHNTGKYKFGPDGNLWTTDGQPWQGGNPFPEPTEAKQVLIANTLSFSRYDSIAYGVRDQETDAAGNVQYRYDFYAVEWQTVGRTVLDPKPYQPGHKNLLRYYPDFVTFPEDLVGTSFLQIWSYDQRKFPLFYGYTPMLKRTRTFPTDQRFEPGVPGDITFTSDLYLGRFQTGRKGTASGNSGAWADRHQQRLVLSAGWRSKRPEVLPHPIGTDTRGLLHRAPSHSLSPRALWQETRLVRCAFPGSGQHADVRYQGRSLALQGTRLRPVGAQTRDRMA